MKKQVKRVSPSQISAFKACPMAWFFGWVLNIRSPSTESQIRGSDIHQHAEDYVEGKVEMSDLVAAQGTGKHYLASLVAAVRDGKVPRISELPGIRVEQHAGTMVFDGTVKANGKIDLTYPWPEDITEPLVIRDWKSCKSFRYCKSPEQLKLDDQCIFYSNEMLARGWKGPVIFEHFYLRTNSSEYQLVRTPVLSQKYLREQYLDMERVVCQMKSVAAQKQSDVTKDKTACRNDGGSFHLDPCSRIHPRKTEGKGIMGKFNLNLAGTRGRKEASAPAAAISPLAARLNQQQSEPTPPTPPTPTRYEKVLAVVTTGADVLRDVDWDSADVEATQATFQEDIYTLSCRALESTPDAVLKALAPHIDNLEEDALAQLLDGVGHVVENPMKERFVADVPRGDVNPPDASPNHHPAPGEEPLRDLGLKATAANPLARAGVVNMRDLISHLQTGAPLTDLEKVGAGAATAALYLAVEHLLSGKEIPTATTGTDECSDKCAALLAHNNALEDEVSKLRDIRESLASDRNAAEQKLQMAREEIARKADAPIDEQADGFTLYVNCHVDGAVPLQNVLAEMLGEDAPATYSAKYDDGRKSVASTTLGYIDEITENYPEISCVGDGFLTGVMLEVLLPHATRVVRGS